VTTANFESRTEVLRNLISLSDDLQRITGQLSNMSWDCSKPLVCLTRQDLLRVLAQFLDSSLSFEKITEWANLIEGREDIAYEAVVNPHY
jgi:hypothetical protein